MRFIYLSIVCGSLMLSCNTSKPKQETAFNENASINTTNTNPLNGIAINTFIHSKEHTVAILYGNETAVQYARMKGDGNYPKGSILSLVTWKQKSDPRWFGANIPDSVLKVEVLRFDDSVQYFCYTGKDMKQSVASDANSAIQWMKAQRSAILP